MAQTPARHPVIGQFLCTLAIALGTGLLVAGNSFDPSVRVDELPPRLSQVPLSPRDAEFYFGVSAALKGFGAAFLALGILALIIPWFNALIYGRAKQDPGAGLPQ